MSSDQDPEGVDALDDLISAWWLEQDEPTIFHDGVEHLASTPLARAIAAAGWVSPEEYRALLDAGTRISEREAAAKEKIDRVEKLVDGLEKGTFDTSEARALAWWVARRLRSDLEDNKEDGQ